MDERFIVDDSYVNCFWTSNEKGWFGVDDFCSEFFFDDVLKIWVKLKIEGSGQIFSAYNGKSSRALWPTLFISCVAHTIYKLHLLQMLPKAQYVASDGK